MKQDVKKAIQGAPFRNPPKEKTIMVVRCPKCGHLIAKSLIEEHKKTCKGQEQHSNPSGAQNLTSLLQKAQREG